MIENKRNEDIGLMGNKKKGKKIKGDKGFQDQRFNRFQKLNIAPQAPKFQDLIQYIPQIPPFGLPNFGDVAPQPVSEIKTQK